MLTDLNHFNAFFFFWHLSPLKFSFISVVTLLMSVFANLILDLVTKSQILNSDCLEYIYFFLSASKSTHFRVYTFKKPTNVVSIMVLFPNNGMTARVDKKFSCLRDIFCPLLTALFYISYFTTGELLLIILNFYFSPSA